MQRGVEEKLVQMQKQQVCARCIYLCQICNNPLRAPVWWTIVAF